MGAAKCTKLSAGTKLLAGKIDQVLQLLTQLSASAAVAQQVPAHSTACIHQDPKTGELYSLEWAAPFKEKMKLAAADQACKELRAGGHTDWRLPEAYELESKLDRSRYNPATADPEMKSEWYWTSTAWAPNPSGCAVGVLFNYGLVNGFNRSSHGFARACRRVAAGQVLAIGASKVQP